MAFRPNMNGEIINIGPDEEIITIINLAERIANQLRFNLNPVFVAGRPQEVTNAICSSERARNLLNYKTRVDLDTGLSDMITYVRHRGVRPFKYHIDLEIVNGRTPKTWTERLF
jgi:UDP-glucose 4-epimerase